MSRSSIAMLSLAVAACGGGGAGPSDSPVVVRESSPAPAAAATYTATLRVGQRVTISEENLTIEMVSAEDHRCPTTLICVWQGIALVGLTVTQAGLAPAAVVADNELHIPSDDRYGPYQFTLVAMDPRRETLDGYPAARYRATVRIDRR